VKEEEVEKFEDDENFKSDPEVEKMELQSLSDRSRG
jgi:hypothetical protein